MKTITEEQFAKIAHLFPVQRGNVMYRNLDVLNALLHVMVNGCTWRGLSKEFGCWHTIYIPLPHHFAFNLTYVRWTALTPATNCSRNLIWTWYTRISRWMKADVITRIFTALQQKKILKIDVTVMSLDSTSVKVHPDGLGALKKRKTIDRKKSRWMEYQTSSGYRR